jgi:hypothetical protein
METVIHTTDDAEAARLKVIAGRAKHLSAISIPF